MCVALELQSWCNLPFAEVMDKFALVLYFALCVWHSPLHPVGRSTMSWCALHRNKSFMVTIWWKGYKMYKIHHTINIASNIDSIKYETLFKVKYRHLRNCFFSSVICSCCCALSWYCIWSWHCSSECVLVGQKE